MTWEHPGDVYPERARAARSVFGRPGFHRARPADLAGPPLAVR
ncbi:hypothetical protein ACWD4O_36705 [Streptomyces sp. NPDC002623]